MYVYVSTCEHVVSRGDHVAIRRGLYVHHCIYMGDGICAHLTLDGVVQSNIDVLVGKRCFWVIRHPNPYSPHEIIERVNSRLYDDTTYNLIFNNCEHFCSWACTGFRWSSQVFGTMAVGWWFGPLGHIIGQIANNRCQKYRLRR